MLLIIFLILFLLLSISAYTSYISRKKNVVRLMTHYAHTISATIRKSAYSSHQGYQIIIHHLKKRIFSALRYVDVLDQSQRISSQFLAEFAEENSFKRIHVINKAGEIIYTNAPEILPPEFLKQLAPIFNSEQRSLDIGIHTLANHPFERYTVVYRRTRGGAIIGSYSAQRLFSARRLIGIHNFINSLNEDTSIVYIAIQDSSGLIAKTKNVDTLPALTEDQLLTQVNHSQDIRQHITTYHHKNVFETILPFQAESGPPAIIRIGLDYKPIQKIQQATLYQAFIRLGALFIIGFVLIAFTVVLQNIQLLKNEKQNITQEVYGLQNDLRRKEKMSAIGELAAGVAHKIRNPLNAISMTIQRLKSEFQTKQDPEEYQHLIHTVRKEINHISEIIKQFLQFSKPAPLSCNPVDINQLAEKVIASYRPKARQKQIRFIWSPNGAIVALVDAEKIEHCLANLIDNALDACMEKETIELSINKKWREIVIRLRDTGAGITQENLAKIFNLYFTTKNTGTGIGLAQVYQIINEHDGNIAVQSQPGQGTTFTIRLPRNKET